MHTLNDIRARLAARPAERLGADPGRPAPRGPHTREAAVAVILRAQPEDVGILFIKRAEKRGDPWSGHMAFPGGHREPTDADTRAAAMRETLEEIGLDLAAAEYLGPLEPQQAMPRGRALDMIIEPHVFALDGDAEPSLTLNYEVEEVVWTDLGPLMQNRRHDTMTRPMTGRPTVFNGFRLERGHFVWGLTYRMLKSLFVALDPDWRAADRE